MNLDTSTPTGKLMLNLLGATAEFEREFMLERQRGHREAKAEGKYQGQQPTARRKGVQVLLLGAEGNRPTSIVKTLGISRASVFRILAETGPVSPWLSSRFGLITCE